MTLGPRTPAALDLCPKKRKRTDPSLSKALVASSRYDDMVDVVNTMTQCGAGAPATSSVTSPVQSHHSAGTVSCQLPDMTRDCKLSSEVE